MMNYYVVLGSPLRMGGGGRATVSRAAVLILRGSFHCVLVINFTQIVKVEGVRGEGGRYCDW